MDHSAGRAAGGLTRRTLIGGAAAIAATSSVVVPAGAVEATTTEVAPGLFVHTGAHELANRRNLGDIANIGFVVGDDAVAVIDTGGSPAVGASLREAIAARTDRPIRYVINTHMHPDHVFGNVAFSEDAPAFVGHVELRAALVARGEFYLRRLDEDIGPEAARQARLIPPDTVVETTLSLDLGNRVLEITAHPTAHTNNDLTIVDRASGTLWAADLVFMRRSPSLDGSALGWLRVLDALTAQAAARVVPGHGPAAAEWPGAAADLRRYLGKVVDGVRDIQKRRGTIEGAVETVAVDERDNWLLFEEYHPRLVTLTFAELEWE